MTRDIEVKLAERLGKVVFSKIASQHAANGPSRFMTLEEKEEIAIYAGVLAAHALDNDYPDPDFLVFHLQETIANPALEIARAKVSRQNPLDIGMDILRECKLNFVGRTEQHWMSLAVCCGVAAYRHYGEFSSSHPAKISLFVNRQLSSDWDQDCSLSMILDA